MLKDALDRKRTYKEHRDFLVSFPNYKEVIAERGMGRVGRSMLFFIFYP